MTTASHHVRIMLPAAAAASLFCRALLQSPWSVQFELEHRAPPAPLLALITDADVERVAELNARRRMLARQREAMGDLANTFDPEREDEINAQIRFVDAELEAYL